MYRIANLLTWVAKGQPLSAMANESEGGLLHSLSLLLSYVNLVYCVSNSGGLNDALPAPGDIKGELGKGAGKST
jgi:hypothetical protein